MTTKDYRLSEKADNIFGESKNDEYSSLNLNHNYQSFHSDKIQSKSVFTKSRKTLNYDLTDPNDLSERNDLNSWNKSGKQLSSSFLNHNRESEVQQRDFKKPKSANNSTLSLHIAAYENSIENKAHSNDCESNDSKDKSESEKTSLIKKWNTSKHGFIDSFSFIQNPFEFPRQQKENQNNHPEVMQFKASQRLRNPNEEHLNFDKRTDTSRSQENCLSTSVNRAIGDSSIMEAELDATLFALNLHDDDGRSAVSEGHDDDFDDWNLPPPPPKPYIRPSFGPPLPENPFENRSDAGFTRTDPFAFFNDVGILSIENVKGKPLQTAKGRVYAVSGDISSKTIDAHDSSLPIIDASFLTWKTVPSYRQSFNSFETADKKPKAPKDFVPPVRNLSIIHEDDDKCASEYAKVGDYDECVNVYGVSSLKTMDTWDTSGLPDTLLANIKRANYPYPRQIQRTAMPLILDGVDLLVCTETGSGKTMAFLVPMIARCMEDKNDGTFFSDKYKVYGLVISPTRELAHQIYEQACKFAQDSGVSVAKSYGEYNTYANTQELGAGCDIVICTPGRLHHLYESGMLGFRFLKFLVFDEADLILGNDFMDDIHPIIEETTANGNQRSYQVLFFSATFSETSIPSATKYMRQKESASIFSKKCATNKLCIQNFQRVMKLQKFDKLCDFLEEQYREVDYDLSKLPRILVFVNSQSLCDELAQKLTQEYKCPALSISGLYAQDCRFDSFENFRRGDTPVMITTDLCARGIDIKDVDYVVNYELPRDIGTYIYRVGRVGRIKEGQCLSFVDPGWNKHIILEILQVLQVVHHPVSIEFDELVEEAKRYMERGDEFGDFEFFDNANGTNAA